MPHVAAAIEAQIDCDDAGDDFVKEKLHSNIHSLSTEFDDLAVAAEVLRVRFGSIATDEVEVTRSRMDARSLLNKTRQRAFVVGLYGLPVPLEVDVESQRLQTLEFVFQIRYPSLADVPTDERAQFRVAQREPAPRRYTIGDVEKLLRRHPVEVAEHRLL